MAFTYGNTVMWSLTGTVPTEWFKAAAAVTVGQILIMDNSGSGAGQVKPACAVTTAFDTDALEGGVVGVALNDAASAGQVQVALITSVTGLTLPAKAATTPSEAVLGVAPATYYVLYRNTAGDWTVDCGTTTKGIVRIVNLDPSDNQNTGVTIVSGIGTTGGFGTSNAGGAGTNVKVAFPSSVRHYNA